VQCILLPEQKQAICYVVVQDKKEDEGDEFVRILIFSYITDYSFSPTGA
jgi:hypothetical protein